MTHHHHMNVQMATENTVLQNGSSHKYSKSVKHHSSHRTHIHSKNVDKGREVESLVANRVKKVDRVYHHSRRMIYQNLGQQPQ